MRTLKRRHTRERRAPARHMLGAELGLGVPGVSALKYVPFDEDTFSFAYVNPAPCRGDSFLA